MIDIKNIYSVAFVAVLCGCASPPASDPSRVESVCAHQCSSNLATCSSGFKLFPVVQQQQCNDVYDVCIKGCPARGSTTSGSKSDQSAPTERLKRLNDLLQAGAITREEYEAKRKEILGAL